MKDFTNQMEKYYKIHWRFLGKPWGIHKNEEMGIMEKTYFIHINKNIEPIDKITEQDMKKFKNGLFIKRFNKQLEENKKKHILFFDFTK